ncbi:lactate utilization protein [Bacteroidales bacterium OttesenSCG-928-K03]|nr:lactate utilization protein [Odoribacter sp. OttesenSCG-928-L07]MDL2240149.1 lactate utilization protein [Bacteroidales bacterium OttesenSCG-928-K22]MDL2242973.1 lactate utilization protein [Bacteroidales bacterium OttesenSCG-928-K03]
MSDSIAKEKVIRAIITALEDKDSFDAQLRADVNGEYFTPIRNEAIPLTFAENFIDSGGVFIFCENTEDLCAKLAIASKNYKWNNIFCNRNIIKAYLEQAGLLYKSEFDTQNSFETGIILCESLIARHGSIVVSASSDNDSKLLSSSTNLVVIAYVDQIVSEIKDAMQFLKDKFINSFPPYISVITGPCKTNSIENKFVVGGQGHKSISLFLVNDKN